MYCISLHDTVDEKVLFFRFKKNVHVFITKHAKIIQFKAIAWWPRFCLTRKLAVVHGAKTMEIFFGSKNYGSIFGAKTMELFWEQKLGRPKYFLRAKSMEIFLGAKTR